MLWEMRQTEHHQKCHRPVSVFPVSGAERGRGLGRCCVLQEGSGTAGAVAREGSPLACGR